MNVNLMGQNSLINISRVNQSIANRTGKTPENTNGVQGMRGDTASISPQGKAMSLIDNLMKQKERIQEQKSELKTSAIDSEGGISSISEQLKSYDEQLENIDEQIAAATTEQVVDDDAKKMENNTYKKPEPKTKEEVVNDRLSDVVNSSNDLKQMEITHAVKGRVDSETRILKSEGKSAQGAAKERNLEQISDNENHSLNISNQLSKQIATVNDKIDENTIIDKVVETGNVDKNTATDKIAETGNVDKNTATDKIAETENTEDGGNISDNTTTTSEL